MSENVKERIKKLMKSIDEQYRREIYDEMVEIFGKEVVGEFKEYLRRPDGYWNLEKCIESAKQFWTRIEWQDGEKSAYAVTLRNG